MRPDPPLDELRAADPARRTPAPPDVDWDALAARITAAPRRPQRRRALLPVAAAAAAALAIVALLPGQTPSVVDRAYAAVSQDAIYHYTVTFQELEHGRPVPGTRSEREAWVDPASGRIRERFASGEERVMGDGGGSGSVLAILTRSIRAGELSDDGPTQFEGRNVRRLVARNAEGTWRQTFLVDAQTYLPVLFRSDTGGERIIEERYGTFERLPDDASLLEPHGPARGPQPAPAPSSSP